MGDDMQPERPSGSASSWRVPCRIVLFSFLLVMLIPGAIGVAAAKATLAVKLPKLPGATKPVLISVRTIEAETGRLLGIVYLKRQSSQVQLKADAVPQIVFADLYTSEGDRVSGHSHVLRPVDRKKMTVTLQMESETLAAFPEMTVFPGGSFPPRADAPSPPVGIGRVGVPSSGFTIDGLDQQAAGIASMVTTDMGGAPCYDEEGGFVVVETDPDILGAIQAEIDLSNSTWADPATRLQNLYVPPTYFVNGSLSSDGATLTVTYRLVDSQGNELLSQSGTGPADNPFGLHTQVAKELANAMCCGKSQKVKCAKTGSIDIDEDYDIPNPECPTNHQSYQGNIKLSLNPALTDPQNACEYSGEGTSQFKSDSDCTSGVFLHVTCTIAETVVGKVLKPVFPSCGSFVVDFTEVWNCTSVDNVGTQTSTYPGAFTEILQYKDGYVLDIPLHPSLVGHARFILHLK